MEILLAFVILFILPVFFWRWLYSKYVSDKDKRDIAIIISTGASTILFYFLFTKAVMYYITYEPREAFNQAKWQANTTRFTMGDELVESKILIGKDTTQLKEILGNPTFRHSANLWTYEMGTGPGGLGFMMHSLAVHLDSNNRTIKLEHVRIKD
jgi:hypothetical protein